LPLLDEKFDSVVRIHKKKQPIASHPAIPKWRAYTPKNRAMMLDVHC
jgi:hypothetical protein